MRNGVLNYRARERYPRPSKRVAFPLKARNSSIRGGGRPSELCSKEQTEERASEGLRGPARGRDHARGMAGAGRIRQGVMSGGNIALGNKRGASRRWDIS